MNDIAKALQQWDAALKLLPAASRQYQVISAKVAALSEKTDKGTLTDTGTSVPVSDTPRSSLGWGKSLGGAAAIAHVAAWINLFNLLPIWQLDGSRGFRALSRAQRWLIVVAIGGVWLWTGEGLLVLLLIVALGRALVEKGSETTDWPAFASFSLLIVLLSLFFLPAAHPSCLP